MLSSLRAARFVWTTIPRDGWWNQIDIYDVERATYLRSYTESVPRISIRPLLGLDEPRVIAVRDRATVTVYGARGAAIGPTHEGLPVLLLGAVVHPSGKGLFALMHDGERESVTVRWVELTADGTPLAAPADDDRILPTLDPTAPCETAVSLDARVAFVLGFSRRIPGGVRPQKRLLGFALHDKRIELAFDVEVCPRLTLAQDEAARFVWALSPHAQGIEVVRLDVAPPSFPVTLSLAPTTPPLGLDDLTLSPRRPCTVDPGPFWCFSGIGGGASTEYLPALKGENRRGFFDKLLDPETRPSLVARYAAMLPLKDTTFPEAFAAAIRARYPDDPELQQVPAQRAAYVGDWVTVRDLLAPIDPTPLDDAPAQHHDHLLGSALLMSGDVEGARRVLARGAARAGGACDLSVPLALAGESTPSSPTHAAVHELDRPLRAADACLAARDLAGARRALSGLVVREAREVQTLARLCQAWLSEPDETDPASNGLDGFSRRLALAAFGAAHAERAPHLRRELPFAGARWDEQRLNALAAEADAWLKADEHRPRPGDTEPGVPHESCGVPR